MDTKTISYHASLTLSEAVQYRCRRAVIEVRKRFFDESKPLLSYFIFMYNATDGVAMERKYIHSLLAIADSTTPRLVVLSQLREEGLFTKDLSQEDIAWLEEPQA